MALHARAGPPAARRDPNGSVRRAAGHLSRRRSKTTAFRQARRSDRLPSPAVRDDSYLHATGFLHPSLLDPDYWRKRLELQQLVRHGLLTLERPDLSSRSVEVQEIKFRAHDGVRLWGLVGRCPLFQGERPVRLRVVGPAEPVRIDGSTVEGGVVEFVVQEPPGRRLEDRVMDVVRLCRLAAAMAGVDTTRIAFFEGGGRPAPDEFLIADRLREGGLLAGD